jgi:hypothetical protein
MRRSLVRRIGIFAAGGLLVAMSAACGDDSSTDDLVTDEEIPSLTGEETEGAPPASEGGEGTYAWVTEEGALVNYTIPAPEDDPEIQRIEAFRNDTGSAPISYVFVEIDNTEGIAQSLAPLIDVVTEDGQTFTFNEAHFIVGNWSNDISDEDEDLKDESVDLYESLLARSHAQPGAKSTTIFAEEGELPDVARVFSNGLSLVGNTELAKVDA